MRKILVMDCSERETFWTTLRSDYEILFASTAEEGLNMLSDNVGLVFLSMRLPDMNGMEALTWIKKEHPSTDVIMITQGGAGETHGAREEGNQTERHSTAETILNQIRILVDTTNGPQFPPYAPQPADPAQDEQYPDIPAHLVDRVLKVRDFVAQNYSGSLTLAAACKMASISRTYFCRFFRCITGHSLRSYHHMVKTRIAQDLLKDGKLSVKEVAMKLGYNDPNYFSTIYKRITGDSPKRRQTYCRRPDPSLHMTPTSDQNLDKSKEVLDRI